VKRRPPQVSIRGPVFDRLKAHVIATYPKHERHGAMSRLVSQLIDSALDAQESK
jgi:hypothetical protein